MINTIYRPSIAEINLKNLDHNLSVIMNKAGADRFVCPMIKADAYGHGAVVVAKRILKNYQLPLGVALIEEALQLREAGIQSDIIVFGGFNRAGAKKIVEARLTPVVSQREQLDILAEVAQEPLDIHVKFNTGMNRLGFDIEEADFVLQFLKNNGRIQIKGLMSHLHSAYLAQQENSQAGQQAKKLLYLAELFKSFGVVVHLLNSDAIVNLELASAMNIYKWGFRPGIMLYGYVSSAQLQQQLNLKPVMSLRSRLQSIRKIKKGETVSYDATWEAPCDSVIGVVPMGYADGVHRSLSNRGQIFIMQQQVPIRGIVCMDYTMVDLTSLDHSLSWSEAQVELFGPHQGADVFARTAETISYEILTSVSSRIPRSYVEAWT